jgi:hypothetical protein
MKSYSDELPNVDKDKLETMSRQLVDDNLKINDMAYEVSTIRTSAAVAAAFSVLASIISIVILVVALTHRVPTHFQ